MPRVANPRAGENRIAATLDKIDLIAQRQREAREYMAWFLPAWGLLSDDERFVLEAFYLGTGSQDDAVQQVSDHFYVERSTAHQKKSRALGRLAVALFGRRACEHSRRKVYGFADENPPRAAYRSKWLQLGKDLQALSVARLGVSP